MTTDAEVRDLLATNDAMVWARAFVETIRTHPRADPTDERFMVGWFANAMAADEFAARAREAA